MKTGPKLPRTMLQKMAGLCWIAHFMYWRGASQKMTGAMIERWV